MKTLVKVFGLLFFMTNAAFAQVTWTVDPAHTNARFEVNHLGIAFVDGEFTKLNGTVETTSETDFNNAKVNFTISIDTRVQMRDDHLRSDDFFNAEKFPHMTLANAVLSKDSSGKYVLSGDLTIRDVTKKVTFDVVQNNGIITDPWGGTRAGFTAKTKINRFDYNINYADKLPSGVFAVAPEILITVNTEVVKK
jgi:polyisoprenoid-binding protein YceI